MVQTCQLAEVLDRRDSFLLTLIAQGDHSAFNKIFQRYQSKVLHVALGISKSRADAEDCVQQVFMQLWLKRETLKDIENFDAFLCRCASNYCLNKLKQSLRIELHENPQELSTSVERTPQEELEGKHLNEFLHTARQKLPTQQRRAFALSRDRSLSIAQIATALNIAESTAKEHVSKAIQTLRKQSQGYLKLEILLILGINIFF